MPYTGSIDVSGSDGEDVKQIKKPSLDLDSIIDTLPQEQLENKAATELKPVTKPNKIKLPSDLMEDNDPSFYLSALGEMHDPEKENRIRSHIDATKLAYKIADLNIISGRLWYKQAHGLSTDDEKEYLKNIDTQIKNLSDQAMKDPYVAKSLGSVLPFLKESAIQGGKGALVGYMIGGTMAAILGNITPGAQVLPEEAITVPISAAIGSKIGASFQSLENMREIEFGSAFSSLVKAGVDEGVSFHAANLYSGASTALEAAGLKILTNMLPGAKTLVNSTIKEAIKKTLTRRVSYGISEVAIGEAGVETSQQFIQNVVEEATKIVNDKLKQTNLSEHEKRGFVSVLTNGLKDTFFQTMIGFGLTAVPGVSVKQMIDTKLNIGDAKAPKQYVWEGIGESTITPEKKKPTKKKKKPHVRKDKVDIDKETPPPTVDDAIDKVINEEEDINNIKIKSKIINHDMSEDSDTMDLDVSKDEIPDETIWNEFKSKLLDKETLAQIIGKKHLENAEKIKVQPKDLRQPAILLQDGTIIKGPSISKWTISDPKDSITEIPNSFSAAREVARTNGFDVENSTTGFLTKGKFLNSEQVAQKLQLFKKVEVVKDQLAIAVEHFIKNPQHTLEQAVVALKESDNVKRNVVRQAKSMYSDLAIMMGEVEKTKQEVQKLKDQQLRKSNQSDRLAVTKIKKGKYNIIQKVVRKIMNTSLGKYVDQEDVAGQAHQSLWEYIRKSDSKTVKDFTEGTNKSEFKGKAYKYILYDLQNFIKEQFGKRIGLSRNQIDIALKEGTLKEPLSLDEALVTEFETGTVEEGAERGKATKSIIDKQIKKDNVPESAKVPGKLKSISVDEYLKQKEIEERKSNIELAKQKAKGQKAQLAQSITEQTKIKEKVKELKEKERQAKQKEIERRKQIAGPGGETGEKTRRNVQSQKDRRELGQSTGRRASDIPSVKQTKRDIVDSRDILKEMKSKLSQKKGESPELKSIINITGKIFNNILNTFKSAQKKVATTFDIEWQWKKINAPKVGLALKNIFSRQDAEERQALRLLNDFQKSIKEGFKSKKLIKDDLANIVLVTELPYTIRKFDTEYQKQIEPAVKWLRDFFVKRQEQLKDRGIDVDYKQRMLSDIDQEILGMVSGEAGAKDLTAESFDRRQKLLDLRKDISAMQFVHIPLQMWFDTQVKKAKQAIYASDIGGYKKAKAKLKLLTTVKRHGSLINRMLNKEVIQKHEINPVEIILNYSRRFGHDMAIADVRDAAMNEGLIKILKSKPKKGNWRKIPIRLAALQVQTPKGKNAYIANNVMNYLDESLSAKFVGNWFTRALSVLKMTQFYNPLILPMYDVIQSGMGTLSYITKYPKAFTKTIKDIHNKTEDYYNFLRNGLASKPFAMPFRKWVEVSNYRTEKLLGNNVVKSWGTAYLKELTKSPTGFLTTLLKTPYIASWNAAWTLDEYVRVFTANVFKEAGLDIQNSAQMAAKFHGDYASVPAKTRKVLNSVFFTPTFKIVMSKLWWNMFKSSITAPLDAHKGDVNKAVFAKGLLAAMAINVAFDLLLTSQLGFDDDKFFRRYKKKIWTEEGPKELVVTLSNPANFPFKMYYQLVEPYINWAVKENKPLLAVSLKHSLYYELHPVYKIYDQFSRNERLDHSQIVSEFDDNKTQAKKYAKFFAEELYPVLKGAKSVIAGEEVGSKERQEAIKAIKRDFNRLTECFIDWLAFSYVRNPEDLRIKYNLERMNRNFKKQMRDYVKQEGKINKEWINNLNNMIDEAIDELEPKK